MTTLLNPAVWLLLATAVAGLGAWLRGRSARDGVDLVLRYAVAWPVLTVLVGMTAVGIGSRAVLGFLAPGAYAEEVVAARSFLEARQLYSSEPRDEAAQWLAESHVQAPPWANVPGVSPCRASSLTDRAKFFTNHAHTPMLLIAGVPIVKLAGGHALYAVILLLSLFAVLVFARVLLERAGIPWRSRQGILMLAAVAGWQPVLAGIRQGDAVIPMAGLVVLAWHLAGTRERPGLAGAAAGIAATFALPAIGVVPALVRSWRRSGWIALLIVAAALGGTMALAGAGVVPQFAQTIADTARTYAFALTNYSVLGRAGAAGLAPIAVSALVAAAVLVSWLRGGRHDDAFGAFSVLGLLVAPVVWSQHLALVVIPVAILFARIWRSGSPLALTAWAVLVLVLSLPDASAATLSEMLPLRSSRAAFPVLSIALVMLWGWVVSGAAIRLPVAAATDAVAVSR